METRLKIDLTNGTLDVAGEEAFVKAIYQDFKGDLLKMANTIKLAPPPPAGTLHTPPPKGNGQTSIGLASFDTLGDCFGSYQGESKLRDVDTALIGAAYYQVKNGVDKFGSQEVNSELKNIGRRLSNVTDSLTPHLKTKPARIIQLKKSGNSRQARKEYKVTDEGIKEATRILGNPA